MKKGKKLIVFILVLAMLVSNFSFVEAAEVEIAFAQGSDGNGTIQVSDLAGYDTLRVYASATTPSNNEEIGWLGWGTGDARYDKQEGYSFMTTNKTQEVFEFSIPELLNDVGNYDSIFVNVWKTGFKALKVTAVKADTPTSTSLYTNNTSNHGSVILTKAQIQEFDTIEVTVKSVVTKPTTTGTIGGLCIGTSSNNYNNWGVNDGSSLFITVANAGASTSTTVFKVSDLLAAMDKYDGDGIFVNVYDISNQSEDYVLSTVVGYGTSAATPTPTPKPTSTPTPTPKPTGTATKIFTYSSQNQYCSISYSELSKYDTIEIVLQKRTANATTQGGEAGALCIGTASNDYNNYITVEPFTFSAGTNETNPKVVFNVSDILAKMETNESVFVNIFNFYEGTSEYTLKEVNGYKGTSPSNPTPTPTNKPAGPTPTPTELWGGYEGNGKLLLDMIGPYEYIEITIENISPTGQIGGLCLDPDNEWASTTGFTFNATSTSQTFRFSVDEIFEAASGFNNDYAITLNVYDTNAGSITSVKGVGTREYDSHTKDTYEPIGEQIVPETEDDYRFTRAQLEMYSRIQVVIKSKNPNTYRPVGKEIASLMSGQGANGEEAVKYDGTQFYSSGGYFDYEMQIFDVEDLLKAMGTNNECWVNAYDEDVDTEENEEPVKYIIHEIRAELKQLDENVIYEQTTPVVKGENEEIGTYNIRFVQLITKEQAAQNNWVEYHLTRSDGKKAVLSGKGDPSSKYNRVYDEVRTIGTRLYAGEGHYYLAITIMNVPENIDLTCQMVMGK